MTLGELNRALQSKERSKRRQLQERATFDYIHAELIGRSMARLYSSSVTMPEMQEVYSTLFTKEEIEKAKEMRQEQMQELSAIRFRLFADSHNQKIKEVQTSE